MPKFIRETMAGRHDLRAIVGNSSWLFLDKVLRLGVGLLVGIWVARYLGPDRYGLLSFAIAFTSFFGALATLGLDGIVVRDLVKFPEKRDLILGSAFVLKLAGSLTAFAISIISIMVLRRGETLTLWVVALTATGFIFQSLNVIDLLFQARVQSRYTVYAANSAFILMTLTKVALLLVAAPLIAFAWAGLGELALTAAFLLVAYHVRRMEMRAWRPNWKLMLEMFSASWPLMLSGISIMISTRVDQVLIGQMLNDKQVGIYSVAARVAEMWYFIPLGIAASAFPLLIESKKQGEQLYYQRLQKLYDLLVMLAIGVAVIMTVLSGPAIKMLYGPAYAGSAGVLSVLIWSGVPVSFGCVWSNWMLLENRTRTMFFFQLTGAVVNIVLNFVLIPRFGIMGSAYATLISYSFGHTILAVSMKSQHRALAMLASAIFPFWRLFRTNTRKSMWKVKGK